LPHPAFAADVTDDNEKGTIVEGHGAIEVAAHLLRGQICGFDKEAFDGS
jgi:hypothetical protein